MRICVGFLFDRPMQALEVLFDEKRHAGLRPGLEANPVALHPVGHLMHLNGDTDGASVKGRRHGTRVWGALEEIGQRVTRRELNDRFHQPAIADESDLLPREPQPYGISLNAKLHMRPTIR